MTSWRGTSTDSSNERSRRGAGSQLAPFLLSCFPVNLVRPLTDTAPKPAGFSLAELAVLLAVLGALFGLSLPAFISYYQGAHVRGAAADVAAYLNQGRQLAIQRNQSTCVHIAPAALHYHLGSCAAGAVWLGPGTEGSGEIPVPAGITLTSTANPVFTSLGAAAPAATITVTHGSHSLNVTVSASGRVTVGP
jgi:Tfp pilus assembly protein FimT